MTDRPLTIERAFQLARSGKFAGPGAIKERLKDEGYPDVPGQISGPILLKQLRRLCTEAASRPEAAASSGARAEPVLSEILH